MTSLVPATAIEEPVAGSLTAEIVMLAVAPAPAMICASAARTEISIARSEARAVDCASGRVKSSKGRPLSSWLMLTTTRRGTGDADAAADADAPPAPLETAAAGELLAPPLEAGEPAMTGGLPEGKADGEAIRSVEGAPLLVMVAAAEGAPLPLALPLRVVDGVGEDDADAPRDRDAVAVAVTVPVMVPLPERVLLAVPVVVALLLAVPLPLRVDVPLAVMLELAPSDRLAVGVAVVEGVGEDWPA